MTTDREAKKETGAESYETALFVLWVAAALGGMLTAAMAFGSSQSSPWPAFLAQALTMLAAFSLVGWLIIGAVRRL